MLTDTECRKTTATDGIRKLADGRGLYLLVNSTGKYWRMDYRFAGKRKTLALGVYPEISVKRAREKCDDARRLLDNGIDPAQEKKARRSALRTAHTNTFEATAKEWLHRLRKRDGSELVPEYKATILRSLELDVFPSLGSRPVSEITSAELLKVLRKIEARGALDTLKRVRQRTSDIFMFAISEGKAENNPAAGLFKALTAAKSKHRAALNVKDMREFFIRIDAVRVSLMVKSAIKLLALTFLRPGELRCGRWCEIDFENARWTVPAERDRSRGLIGMKMREAHTVPLSTQAIAVLRELHNLTGHGDLIFPNRNDHQRPISDGTINTALRAMGYSGDEVSGHGFRATATGALLEMGFKPEIIDRQLAHRERNEVFSAYSYQAQFLAERKKMMQAWGSALQSCWTGAEIIPFGQVA